MKRDMELARQILQRIEECPDPSGQGIDLAFPDHTNGEVSYNVKLLAQARLIDAVDMTNAQGLFWMPQSLTYEGHEFLDAIRNDKVWGKVKEQAREHGGKLSFEVMKALAIQVAKTLLGL
jgi:hypothetical protein